MNREQFFALVEVLREDLNIGLIQYGSGGNEEKSPWISPEDADKVISKFNQLYPNCFG